MYKSEILKADNINKLENLFANTEVIKEGKELLKSYFNTKVSGLEILNNTFISNHNINGSEVIVIDIHMYIQIILDENFDPLFSYIKRLGAWENLNKEQTQNILYKIYAALIKKKKERYKIENIQSKYNLIGYLLKYKFNYNKFISWEITTNNFVCFNFINKEGFKRSWLTTKLNIIDYLNYNDSDITKVLFD